MKSLFKLVALFIITVSLVSCKNDQKPNYQYMPNMYESVAYETYSESNAFKGGKEGLLPPAGTIKRGFVPYELPNTTEGYNASKLITTSPLDSTAVDMKKAEELFTIYCAICHGAAGDGKGKLVKQEKGSIYHVITYGLNAMGSHANQLSSNERWLVAEYVLKLKEQ
jgi:mono/diheme cytochrome c family protein